MSLALIDSQYLRETTAKIRSKPVPWDGYQRASLVSLEELALIKKIDRQPVARQQVVFEREAETYASLFLALLGKLVRIDTVQAVLVGMGDMLTDHPERLDLLLSLASTNPELPFAPLVKVLAIPDEFIQVKAAQLLTVLVSVSKAPTPATTLKPLLSLLSSLLSGSSNNSKDIALQSLAALLASSPARKLVWSTEDPASAPLLTNLAKVLKANAAAGMAGNGGSGGGANNGIVGLSSSSSPQMLYQAGFCFWELSFEPTIAEGIDRKLDLIPILLQVAQSSPKEKVLRIVLATFRNLITQAPQQNLPALLAAGVLPFIVSLQGRKFGDEDLVEDLQLCTEELKERKKSLSTWEEYLSELVSGHLTWSPPHESDEFWKDNANRLNENDGELLKTLVGYLMNAQDPTVLAVAVADVGQYVKHCERGKKLVNNLGAKTRVMELMQHDNPDVRYRALISVQRLISIG